MKTGEKNEDGQTTHEDDQSSKVVRIPRDWFGPRDELVPIGPRASHARGRSVEDHAAPLDPNSFWDECSNSIQDVVGAIGESGTGGAGLQVHATRHELRALVDRLRYPARELPRGIGIRTLAAGVIVLLVAGLGLAGWLLGQARPHAVRPAAVAVSKREDASAPRMIGMAKRPGRVAVQERRKPRSAPAVHRSHVVSVVYRASPPSASSDRSVSYSPPVPQTPSPAETSSSTAGSGASAASTVIHSSQPAYGAAGALGPMSSPDG